MSKEIAILRIFQAALAEAETVLGNAPKAPTHVTADGLLRLPPRVLKIVGVEHGGGVSFVDKGDGVVEMMSDDTFLRRAGFAEDE